MAYFFLGLGLFLSFIDIIFQAKTLKVNIAKRLLYIFSGTACLYYIEPSYLYLTRRSIIVGLIIGILFMLTHIIISKGIKLKIKDINVGFTFTCILIYLIELPAEEFLYRGIILIPMLEIMNPVISILTSSLIFLVLHIKTWDNNVVKIGSFLLGLICAISVYLTKSIWTAIIIHNLNDFGFLTLVNKRNIFYENY